MSLEHVLGARQCSKHLTWIVAAFAHCTLGSCPGNGEPSGAL